MTSIFIKEINAFFSSLIGYLSILVFLLLTGLFLFVFPDTSLLHQPFATLDPLFDIAPLIFIFLIPAITMRSLSEEWSNNTFELIATKPLRKSEIIMGKYFAALTLVLFSILPTILYYYTMHHLGSPVGNLDSGAIWGSFLGLFFLGAVFTSIGILASSLSRNQIVAFLFAAALCFFMYYGFYYISSLPIFTGNLDLFIQSLGIDHHYASISRGVIDTRDVIYYLSAIVFFLAISHYNILQGK
nr:gliding motility-associated ABC transporter permease subunit GldF [Saprospiraceae bacterium]